MVEESKLDFMTATDWEISLDSRYNEDEVLSIMNMLSYWDNQHSGYGKRNDEQLYRDEREADKNNKLYDEAMYGLFLMERGRGERRGRKNKRV
jgi:hypothetical protein